MATNDKQITLRSLQNFLTTYSTVEQVRELCGTNISETIRFIKASHAVLKGLPAKQLRIMYYRGKEIAEQHNVSTPLQVPAFSDKQLAIIQEFSKQDIKKATQLRAAI